MKLIEDLKWRYATKKFDSNKEVSPEEIDVIKQSIQLAATSYGLQLFKVIEVENKSIREKLLPASWNQKQVTEASHLFVFCNYIDAKDINIDAYMRLKAEIQSLKIEDLKGYADFIKDTLSAISQEKKQVWMAKQTYIALTNAMTACAALKIDSTPMEGFSPKSYSDILNLESKGLQASLVLAIGYRSEEDKTQYSKKIRKPIKDLFETI
jgi:nitroreductase / dihydropteridine reductase